MSFSCGKGPAFGQSRSHSMVATKRRFDPNLQKVRIVDGQDAAPRLRLHPLPQGRQGHQGRLSRGLRRRRRRRLADRPADLPRHASVVAAAAGDGRLDSGGSCQRWPGRATLNTPGARPSQNRNKCGADRADCATNACRASPTASAACRFQLSTCRDGFRPRRKAQLVMIEADRRPRGRYHATFDRSRTVRDARLVRRLRRRQGRRAAPPARPAAARSPAPSRTTPSRRKVPQEIARARHAGRRDRRQLRAERVLRRGRQDDHRHGRRPGRRRSARRSASRSS